MGGEGGRALSPRPSTPKGGTGRGPMDGVCAGVSASVNARTSVGFRCVRLCVTVSTRDQRGCEVRAILVYTFRVPTLHVTFLAS